MPSAETRQKPARLRRQLTGQEADPQAAAELYRLLLAPIATRLEGRPVVFLSHGPHFARVTSGSLVGVL